MRYTNKVQKKSILFKVLLLSSIHIIFDNTFDYHIFNKQNNCKSELCIT